VWNVCPFHAPSPRSAMTALLRQLIFSEAGQDVIEYALLTGAVGFSGVAVWPLIETALRDSYRLLDTQTQNLWVPPDPIGGGS
jgi:Flp pilus assembly pilin Flp